MKSLSVKTKLALIVAIVFVTFAAGATFFAFRYFEDAYQRSISHDLMLMSATMADSIDSRLVIAENALGAAKAALSPAVLADPVLTQKFIDERVTLRNLFPHAVLVISPGGRLIAANGSEHGRFGEDFSQQDFFTAVVSRKIPCQTAISEQPGDHAEIVVALPQIGPSGEIVAVMVGVTELAFSKLSIESLLRERIGSGSHLYIAARDGAYLLHRGSTRSGERIPAGQCPLFDRALAGAEATGEVIDCDGQRVLASFQKLTRLDSVLMISYPLSLAYAPLDLAKGGFLGAIILGTVVLVLITWFAAARIIEPLRIMTMHVKALPELPHGERQLRLDRDDEVGILAKSFDQLVTTLESREIELLKLNEKYRQRAVELTAMNRDLEAFGSSLSHDLKTPLTSICLAAEALREKFPVADDAGRQYFLSTILAESERMNGLIDAMLLLSRASKDEIHRVDVNLSDMAGDILLRLSSGNPERKAEWTVAPDVVVTGDERLLQAAMENLLGNAWKYTNMNDVARIEFGVLAGEKRVFFVKDNGIGFDMAKAGQLFTPFRRLHDDEKFKGFGIGLATVERIVTRHGGRIWANAQPGLGATFSFTLAAETSPEA
jgi:signal transduction histidine kinase